MQNYIRRYQLGNRMEILQNSIYFEICQLMDLYDIFYTLLVYKLSYIIQSLCQKVLIQKCNILMKERNPLKNELKLPNYLDLGSILPGQYGQSYITFKSASALFLTLKLNSKAIHHGFFILQQGGNQCFESLNVVIKPNKQKKIMVGSYCKQVPQSQSFEGQLIIAQNQNAHKIKLGYQVIIPRIKCMKMMKDISNNSNLLKLLVNKAVTSDVRISLFNQQNFSLVLQPGLLHKISISDKTNPFIMKLHSNTITAEPKQNFMVFLNLQTNIGFGCDHKGLKKVILRNVLTLKTQSVVLWCLPIEITVVFVKQPEIKE